MRKFAVLLLAVGICVSACNAAGMTESAAGCAPPVLRAWIHASDARGQDLTLWFGFDPAASCSVETALCELNPAEICGPPTTLACFYWYVPDCGSDYGLDLWGHDYRSLHPGSQVDTFLLVASGDPPFTFHWSRDSVRKIADSVVVKEWYRTVPVLARMDQEDSLVVVTNSGLRRTDLMLIVYRSGTTPVADPPREVPLQFCLDQNYPNPFNPSTTISYTLPAQSFVTLKVFNVLGQEIVTLVNGIESPGRKSVRFDGSGLPSGVYFYRLQAGSYSGTKMLMVVK